mgnify:CR=1 FL=1
MTQLRYVITGIASGIGAATAAELRAQGHWIIGLDIQSPASPADEFIQLDLADQISIDRAVSQIEGPLHGLCNIAGLPPRPGLETKILQVNYIGLRRLTLGLLDLLNSGSSIVNLASRAGHNWANNVDQVKKLDTATSTTDLAVFLSAEQIDATRAYNLSKEAVILWTKAITEALIQRGIRINSVSPGAIDTPILDDFAQAFGTKMQQNVDRAGRPGQAQEVAPLIAFLLSKESSWINGADITIDGGMSAFAVSDQWELSSLGLK